MDEKPIRFKKLSSRNRKSFPASTRFCIIHDSSVSKNDEIKQLTLTSWNKIQQTISSQNLSSCSTSTFNNICDNIPSHPNYNTHGFHRKCYQRFINIKVSRKRKVEDKDGDCVSVRKRRPTGEMVLFPNECMFCEKNEKWIVRKGKGVNQRAKLVKCQTEAAENSIKEAAARNNDEYMIGKITGIDLIAKEAQYHDECRKAYIRPKHVRKSNNQDDIDMKDAHDKAFEYLKNYIENQIINNLYVERISMLKGRYLKYMEDNFPEQHNPNYKTQKLKFKIQNWFGDRIKFVSTSDNRTEIIYCDSLSTPETVSYAYECSSSMDNKIKGVALFLRRTVIDAHKQAPPMQWPPSNDYINSSDDIIPKQLSWFLRTLLTKRLTPSSERKINSIGQDVCFCITNAAWQLPKALTLAMSIHHLTGSAKLVTLLNRLGHCVSYMRTLEIETAIASSINLSNNATPPDILKYENVVTHFCWDNFDLAEETMTGAGTTHSTHGIAIQEHSGLKSFQSTDTCVPKTKQRCIKFERKPLQPCILPSTKVEPTYVTTMLNTTTLETSSKIELEILWRFVRAATIAPGWGGWLTITSSENSPQFVSNIQYMKPIHQSPTSNDTIQEVLCRSKKVSEELGQNYTIITFDLAMAKKAYSIVWSNPDKFQNVFIRLGTFHIICAFMKAIGKMMEASGFEDIVLESGMCANGSLSAVMSGKHYNRALRIHTCFVEALDRLLLKAVICNKPSAENKWLELKMSILKSKDFESMKHLTSCPIFWELSSEVEQMKLQIRAGKHGRTAQFWLQYYDNVWYILQLLRALRENDFDMYLNSLKQMTPLFFAMKHPNYARYLTVYISSLEYLEVNNIEPIQILKETALSSRRTNSKASGVAIDQTIEQTINKSSKSIGGLIGVSRKLDAYDRWCITRHERVLYVEALSSLADLEGRLDSNKELRLSEMTRGCKSVDKISNAISSYNNPFDVGGEHVVCLSSGVQASKDISKQMVTICKEGELEMKKFIKERLETHEKSFHAPITAKKIQTFGSMKKMSNSVRNKSNKEIKVTAQRNIYGQLIMLAVEHQIDLRKLMSYPLGPIPWTLATSDGSMVKTNKAVLLHKLECHGSNVNASENGNISTHIIDGNVMLHSLISIPETFGQLAKTVFLCLPKVQVVHFVTDSYKEKSIKCTERIRRGTSDTITLKGRSTKVPRDWKSFLCNDDNKKQLIKFIFTEWSSDEYAELLVGRKVYVVCEEDVTLLTTEDGQITDQLPIYPLQSTQEEADTRIVLHANFSKVNDFASKVIVRSTDTDVFLLLLHFADALSPLEIVFDTGVGDKRRFIVINDVIQSVNGDIIQSLLGFHALTGCDSTSAFLNKGKIRPFKTLCNDPELQTAMKDIGEHENLTDEVKCQLEKFVCKMYNSEHESINELRYQRVCSKFHTKNNVISPKSSTDLSMLPPCQQSLDLHLKRVNYQVRIWKTALQQFPELPPVELHGWKHCNNALSIDWGEKMFPTELTDILASESHISNSSDSQSNDLSGDESAYSECCSSSDNTSDED